jgi:adenosylmethionine-8-amino-7-oxononanoate aminotransferase
MTRRASPVWHPFTQHATAPHAIPVVRTEGAWLETADGKRILDAISSWWVVTHGHRHPRIMAAIRAATETLDQVIFAGFTHVPAEQLAQGLVDVAADRFGSGKLTRAFFSDSGSTSVEVAIKMALGYWRGRGEPRHAIAALEHGYHGDTIGTMSAGARGVFNAPYEPLLFDCVRLPFPGEGREQATLDALEAACRAEPIAALLVEPLILGAGGMLTYSAATLKGMAEIAARHGVLLIADEVMTGFGRTGTLFACEQAGVAPDILCLAKGLTGGAVPLAVTLATEPVFEAHFSPDRARMFFHSSSYTANPIACAAGCANLEVWREEPVMGRIGELARRQGEHIARLRSNPRIAAARQLGTIAAFDVASADAGYLASVGPHLYGRLIAAGVLLRPLGNTLYVMPPYCITAAELDLVYEAIDAALAAVV